MTLCICREKKKEEYIQDSVDSSIRPLEDYIEKRLGRLITTSDNIKSNRTKKNPRKQK